MKSIEFLGPSGVGKTTFLKGLLHYRSTNSTWCTGQEILKEINYNKISFLERVLIKGGKYFGANIKTNRDYLEKIKENKVHCSPIIEVFLNYLCKSDLDNWQKVRLFNYYLKTTLYERLLIFEADLDKTVVFDEGIIVNGGITSVLDKEEYRNITSSVIFPKGVVSFDLDFINHRERIQSRFLEKGERKINPLVTNISEDEIEDYIIKAKEKSRRKLEACKILNIPILEMQPFSSEENYKRVLQFIYQVNKQC